MNRLTALVILALAAAGLGALLLGGERASSAPGAQPPMPVQEQNLDANGNLKVHEQGTADVNVTNASLPVAPPEPVTGGGGGLVLGPCPAITETPGRVTVVATALQVSWGHQSGIKDVILSLGNSVVAHFAGPAITGDSSALVLPLTRPVAFNRVECTSNGQIELKWVGNEP